MRIALVHNAKGTPPPGIDSPESRDAWRGELSEEELFAECDAPHTIAALASAIAAGGHDVVPLDADGGLFEALRTGAFDLVFNLAEGLRGEAREAQVPAMLEFLGLPYTGSGPIALALAHDKGRAKEVWSAHGIAVPRGFRVEPGDAVPSETPSTAPWIVKPVAEGSSKGVRDRNVVRSADELRERVREVHDRFRQAALVEEFLEGREFTVALLGNPPRVLPITEIDFAALPAGAEPIYSYEAKWIWDVPEKPLAIFHCPAVLERELEQRIGDLAVAAFEALGCRDWARVDVRLDASGAPRILEINPLPGILPNPEENSCFPKAARAAGIDYRRLILDVVEAARGRASAAQACDAVAARGKGAR